MPDRPDRAAEGGAWPALRPLMIGAARQEPLEAGGVRLVVDAAPPGRYADAQLDDYSRGALGRGSGFRWRPPLRLRVRARLAPEIRGTAGFGFWNNPFNPLGGVPGLPDAVWFFYGSPPNALEFVPGVPGHGWKAAALHARRWGAVPWGVLAAHAVLWARVTGRAERAARWARRLAGAHEALPAVDAAAWHDYEVEWLPGGAVWRVDGAEVLRAPAPPGPLGFVAWVDNQYAVATPRGALGWGLLPVERPQWIDLAGLAIEGGGVAG